MQVLLAGATGFIGRPLVEALRGEGHGVTIVSRSPARAQVGLPAGVQVVSWENDAAWRRSLAATDAVVNLAGESIAGGRWTARRKEAIRKSRVETTRALVEAMTHLAQRPRVLVNASAVGYYGTRGDEEITEEEPPGRDFLAQVAMAWEEEARRAESLGVRVVRLRIGVVLGPGGGALPQMALPFRFFVGGPLGSGRQWVPWIHRDDVVGLIRFALENEAVQGAINATAPHPQSNAAFGRVLGRVLGRPSWLPAPAFALRLALGEMAVLVLDGQRAVPAAALRHGYPFRYPDLEAALRAALGRAAAAGS